MQGLINFNDISNLITLYEQLKNEINSLNITNPNLQQIVKIKTLTAELDNKIQQLKTMLVTTALMCTSNIQKK